MEGMETQVGAGNLGQGPEREEGDFRMTPEELRDEELQGSIDVIIEEWRSSEFTWWVGTEEGAAALAHLYEAGKKIGEYRARKNRPHPEHQPSVDTDPSPALAQSQQVQDENERLRAELAEAKAALEAQRTAEEATGGNPDGYEPPDPLAEAQAENAAEQGGTA